MFTRRSHPHHPCARKLSQNPIRASKRPENRHGIQVDAIGGQWPEMVAHVTSQKTTLIVHIRTKLLKI